MLSVFSKKLLNHYANLHDIIPTNDDYLNIKPSKLTKTKINAISFMFTYDRHLNTDEALDNLLGPISLYEVNKVLKWAHKNIIVNLKIDKPKTTNVKARIVVGMLNKLVYTGILSKDISIELINNFNANLKDFKYDIMFEDLPF